jgi:hypothetical protein
VSLLPALLTLANSSGVKSLSSFEKENSFVPGVFMKGRYGPLLVRADGHGKALSAFCSSPVDDGPSRLAGHSYEKTVGPQSSFLAGLKCSFRHGFFL